MPALLRPFYFLWQIVIHTKVETALAVEINNRCLCAHMGEDAITAKPPIREWHYQHP